MDHYITKAKQWYEEHKDHVCNLIEGEKKTTIPSTEDIMSPSLWKSSHWRWFLKNIGEIK